MPSGSYFFTRINRIGSIVELKFYIRVQEEDIRVQEEFVMEMTLFHVSPYPYNKFITPYSLSSKLNKRTRAMN